MDRYKYKIILHYILHVIKNTFPEKRAHKKEHNSLIHLDLSEVSQVYLLRVMVPKGCDHDGQYSWDHSGLRGHLYSGVIKVTTFNGNEKYSHCVKPHRTQQQTPDHWRVMDWTGAMKGILWKKAVQLACLMWCDTKVMWNGSQVNIGNNVQPESILFSNTPVG